MKNIIVGTAGHIDHGKTALVRALTGVDTDRLEEEKRRGITIDLGFAHLNLTPSLRLGFIDVPGHERFVKNMLAGVGGIDLVLSAYAGRRTLLPDDILKYHVQTDGNQFECILVVEKAPEAAESARILRAAEAHEWTAQLLDSHR